MSDALNYLMQIRRQAMGNYFAFLKQAGDNLDPKTRAIISVITKVDNQTRNGFKQYLKRALNDGVSAAEIIDALLLAFPTLGLSKIIWAIDIILQMDLPEFQAERLVGSTSWRYLAEMDDLPEGLSLHEPEGLDDKGVFVMRQGDAINAYSNICPHQGSWITPEHLRDGTLVCPLHGWEFDAREGHCLSQVGKSLSSYQHKIEQGKLFVLA
ncbi:MAG: Rieske 2Fe-2S domain-containing protein [Gammaproteobacteria bacterium]